MAKLSIIIPSRDEKFLTPTIDDIFRNCRDDQTEVIAVLDSDKWPGDWKEVTDRHPRLHTIHNGQSIGMRGSINKGVASAISRGAKYVAKFDGHCSFSEGFDVALMADCDEDWVVVPRRGRLDPESWTATDTHKPDIDYHYLSFPNDPNDFGGPGLNGKVWVERAVHRKDILIDDEMSSQGSGWFMHASFFQRLGFMDEASYGPFWNEFQELGLCAWLSGGAVKVNKNCRYLHLHKGSKHGRGYHLPERWLTQGRNHTMKWPWNEAWDSRQIRPFSWLIEHFWPVPTWPENWEELLYATRKPREVSRTIISLPVPQEMANQMKQQMTDSVSGLQIHFAYYEASANPDEMLNVTERVRELVKNNSLDIIVNNSTLIPGQNPFRGRRKFLRLAYSFDNGEPIVIQREEKDWLIIGPAQQQGGSVLLSSEHETILDQETSQLWGGLADKMAEAQTTKTNKPATGPLVTSLSQLPPMTAPALNDYLIRRFSISPQRLRGPMPIEVPQFHRNDLAQLFAELGFKRGAEIGVAEGNYSEVLLKANPECELLLVDPWHHYSDNPQGKSKEKHEFAYNETLRKTKDYPNVNICPELSMDAVRDVDDDSLDFVYIDGAHSFNYVLMDLICWSSKVRSGGIIALDDYYYIDYKRWGAGVVEAVQAFTSAHRLSPWFICDAHKSTDAFWVNP